MRLPKTLFRVITLHAAPEFSDFFFFLIEGSLCQIRGLDKHCFAAEIQTGELYGYAPVFCDVVKTGAEVIHPSPGGLRCNGDGELFPAAEHIDYGVYETLVTTSVHGIPTQPAQQPSQRGSEEGSLGEVINLSILRGSDKHSDKKVHKRGVGPHDYDEGGVIFCRRQLALYLPSHGVEQPFTKSLHLIGLNPDLIPC